MGRLNGAAVGVLVLALAVAGCGGSGSTSSSTQTQSAGRTSSNRQTGTQTSPSPTTPTGTTPTATSATPKQHTPDNVIKLSSSTFKEGSAIPARYTCDGADMSPSLHWSAVPRGTTELVLFISDLEATAAGGGVPISWAVAGLRPALKGISAGTLPTGAVVGRNSFGQTRYTLCPPKGSHQHHYIVVLYGLRHSISAQPGFAADAFYKTVPQAAQYTGLSGFSYTR